MDPVFITIAFVLGFLVRQVGLPPMVGLLAAVWLITTRNMRFDTKLLLIKCCHFD